MGSSRLPGKSLLPFGESTLLQHIVRRLRKMKTDVELVVATSALPEDDAIERACEEEGVPVFRGPADDVLARFVTTVGALPARPDLVLRVCADRPLLGARLVDELLAAYDDAGRPDYLSNNLVPSFPDGLDLELVRTDALVEAARFAAAPYEREHVTPFVYRNPDRFSCVGYPCPCGDFSWVRVTIDVPEDYEALRHVHGRLAGADPDYDWRDVIELAQTEPEFFPPAPSGS